MRNFPFICSKEYFVKSEKTHKLLPSITYNLTSKFIIEECYGRGVLKTVDFSIKSQSAMLLTIDIAFKNMLTT